MPEPLPTHPDLGQLRTRAKELRRAVSRRVPDALARVAASHPGYAERPVDPARFTLRDAQATIAHESGFGSWHDLVHEVGTRRVEERDLHRWFGVELNNDTWDLLDTAGEGRRPPTRSACSTAPSPPPTTGSRPAPPPTTPGAST